MREVVTQVFTFEELEESAKGTPMKDNTQHTSEWGIGKSHDPETIAIRFDGSDDEDCIAEVLILDPEHPEESMQRAVLMASAPDLLDALETAESILSDVCENGETPELRSIRAAIAKAKAKGD